MDIPRNMTGLYLGGFVQEGYLPPRERKSTIPSTLYRGHVVKLARAPNANPQRSSVGRYPMHSLNAGFAGSGVPIKDQTKYKYPDKVQRGFNPKALGKWANYPMSIEIRKMAGSGSSGAYLAQCVLGTKNSISDDPERMASPVSRTGSSLFRTSPTNRDRDEELFYRSMYEEIRNVVFDQEDSLLISHRRLKKILQGDTENTMRPAVLTPAHERKRVATSYGLVRKPVAPSPPLLPKRPHTTTASSKDGAKGALLLPVPFVSQCAWEIKPSNDSPTYFLRNSTPWLPKLDSVASTPYKRKAESALSFRNDVARWSNPNSLLSGSHSHGNIGETTADKLKRLLGAAAREEYRVDSDLATKKEQSFHSITNQGEYLNSSPLSDGVHQSLSVVVPASYEEALSLSGTPLPTTDTPLPDPDLLSPLPAPETPVPLPTPTPRTHGDETERSNDQRVTRSLKVFSPKVNNVQLFPDSTDELDLVSNAATPRAV